jgi:hypothetical protein
MRCPITDCTSGCTWAKKCPNKYGLLIGQKAHVMSNKFFGFLTTTGKDVVHVVEPAPKAAVMIGKLLADGVAVEPAVKTQIVNLMEAGEQVALAGGGAAASEGENLALDGEAVAPVQAFVKVFLVAFPVIEKAFSAIASTIKPAAPGRS